MKTPTFEKLIFVYNAKSGIGNAVWDSAHKLFSPDTYECNLCSITHGTMLENKIWKKFRKDSKIEMVFLHKNEFIDKYVPDNGDIYTYPLIMGVKNNLMETFIHTEILDVIETVEELIGLVSEKSKAFFN